MKGVKNSRHKYLFLFSLFWAMSTFALIAYLVNSIIFILMLLFTVLNPQLLNDQYWDYILIGLFSAIVFHSGHATGEKSWFTFAIRYVLLSLFTSFTAGFTISWFTLTFPSTFIISLSFSSLFGYYTRIFLIILTFMTLLQILLLTSSRFPYLISSIIRCLVTHIIIWLSLTFFCMSCSVLSLTYTPFMLHGKLFISLWFIFLHAWSRPH